MIERKTLTICDRCSAWEWGIEEAWRAGHAYGGKEVHLCDECREKVWWCNTCRQFHPADAGCPEFDGD